MKKLFLLFIILCLLVPLLVQASTISGKVQCQMARKNIEGALVILLKPSDESFSKTTVTDSYGNFILENIETGVYNIEAVKDGYFKNILFDLKVEKDLVYNVNIRLLRQKGKSTNEYCFMLGGIEVTSVQRDIIPEEATTIRKIDSGEIEHMQASSLGDILTLVPGIEKSGTPGLSKETHVGIRSVATGGGDIGRIESFGTTIIVDGDELSNDANAKQKGYTGVYGIDLREIPADNIKSVEVITGIPSVEYGNFTNGIIKVETKIGQISPKLKAKINPDTKTASYTGGHRFGNSVLDYHFNYGYSERSLRKVGDEYHRFYLSENYSAKFLNDKLNMKIRSSFTKMIDDEEPTDVWKLKNYNRGYRASGKVTFDYSRNENDIIKGYFGVDLDRKKYFKEHWVNDQLVTETDTLFGFIGKLKEIGKVWKVSAKVQRKLNLNIGKQKHKFLMGIEGDYQKNTGEGLVIDSLRNYYGVYSKKRSYSFNEFPELQRWGLYYEDAISGKILNKKFNLILGLRYDVFNPVRFNLDRIFGSVEAEKSFIESHHGEFLSPRFNFRYFFSDNLRLRFGAGKSAKAVSLAYIYRPPAFDKFLRDSVLVEESYPQENPDLQAYSKTKYEISLDWRIGNILGVSLTRYYSESSDQPTGVGYPWGYDVNPDTITAASYSIYENRGWSKSGGTELAIRTKRLYNLQYKMNVTYRFNHTGKKGLNYDSMPDTSWEEIWYSPYSTWREKVIIDHQISYISKRLGVWVTIDVQQIALEHKKTIYNSNTTTKTEDGEEHLYHQGMLYWYDDELFDYGSRWIFNFRVSKSIFHNTELSLYINNLLDDRGVWENPFTGRLSEFNSSIYYGLEMSMQW